MHSMRRDLAIYIAALCCVVWLIARPLSAEDANQPKAIPPTRVEAKQALENLKFRVPRLPLPQPSADEQGRGGLGLVNNARMRALHLPAELRGNRSGGRQADPNMTLNYDFTVELFWIASRVNNCHYCLGHQEVKLRSAGLPEDRIAALDCDWSRFTDAERAAYGLARKLTLEPQRLSDADFVEVLRHYTQLQVLEIVFHVARYNATNRWTDSLGIPQEGHREFLTPTSAAFASLRSIVAPVAIPHRDPLPGREEALARLADARSREARLPVLTEDEARKVVGAELFPERLPQWVKLLANFPVTGKGTIESLQVLSEKGQLPAQMRDEIAWVAARHDRAWYALGVAARRLAARGYSWDQMFELDTAASLPPDRRAALELTAKLTAMPQAITDADIARVREHFSDSQVAEIVYRVTQAAFFNRVTEAALLTVDP